MIKITPAFRSTPEYIAVVKEVSNQLTDMALDFVGRGNFFAVLCLLVLGLPVFCAAGGALAVYYDSWTIAICFTLIYAGWMAYRLCGLAAFGAIGLHRVADICDSLIIASGKPKEYDNGAS